MSESVRTIKGVGDKTERLLKRLHIETTDQLVHHYPRCYLTYGEPVGLSEIQTGVRCSVYAWLVSPVQLRSRGKRKVCSCLVADQTGQLFLRWFNMPYLRNTMRQGERYVFTGTVIYKDGRLMMEQPEYASYSKYREKMEHFQPVYPLTAGLSNKTLQKTIKLVFDSFRPEEYLPETVRNYYDLMEEEYALKEIHFPSTGARLKEAKKRIIFDEFFRFFAALELVKERGEHSLNHYLISWNDKVTDFIGNLPFPLTEGQKNALADIRNDFAGTMTMNRLLQGDVGSGKTMIAMIAMYAAVTNGYQAIFMAPTEVLARQHFENFRKVFHQQGVAVGILTGSMKAAERKKAREKCTSGEYQMIVGTHALIQEGVTYRNVALVITDEQHRFGVRQREELMRTGKDPHVLVMSATPIPRTLGIILYRDLDVSIMKDMPASRLPVKNAVVGPGQRQTSWNFIKKEVEKGHQAYIICPMIEESESLDVENVLEYSRNLTMYFPPDVRVESLHGQMDAREKADIMDRFYRGHTQILVSTTVIEVGIDNPNATVMLIENAERFGLAQLHQLRGRVGRGSAQSYCIFLSGSDRKEAMDRLSVIGHSNDGFEIAKEDLRQRGPGDFFGTKQSGTMRFALGDIYSNADILTMASEAVNHLKSEGFDLSRVPGEAMAEQLNYARNI